MAGTHDLAGRWKCLGSPQLDHPPSMLPDDVSPLGGGGGEDRLGAAGPGQQAPACVRDKRSTTARSGPRTAGGRSLRSGDMASGAGR